MSALVRLIALAFLLELTQATGTFATTFTVTNTSSSGSGSLYQAVSDANTSAGTDTILFAAEVRGTIYNEGTLVISDPLAMIGPGADLLAISIGTNGRVILIKDRYDMNFLFKGLTFRGGRTPTFSGAGMFISADTVKLMDCIIRDNVSTYHNMGGGGAIFSLGHFYLINCLIMDNRSCGGGAGISISSSSNVFMSNTSICNNMVPDHPFYGGGGIYNAGNLEMENCTVSGNSQQIKGGAIYSYGYLKMNNCTVTDNSSDTCGGIYENSPMSGDTVITIRNSIVAGNISTASYNDLRGRIYSYGYNLIGDRSGAVIVGNTSDDLYDVDPMLSTLDSISPTVMLHRLEDGSPAIDRADNVTCSITDQRGIARPQDGDEDGSSVADIGAYEAIVDADEDGIPNSNEMGPNGDDAGYDGNEDGTPDHSQSNVTSMWNFNSSSYVTIAGPDGAKLLSVQAVKDPSSGDVPGGVSFPVGFFRFTVDLQGGGPDAEVKVYLPDGVSAEHYFKYGSTPDTVLPHWYLFDYNSSTGAEIISPGEITLHLTDGSRGDDDLTANGLIVDAGGPSGTVTAVETGLVKPDRFALYQNFPNPFNPSTKIRFVVPGWESVSMKVFDVLGRCVATLVSGKKGPGTYTAVFDGSGFASGVYFYRLKAGDYSAVKKMLLVK